MQAARKMVAFRADRACGKVAENPAAGRERKKISEKRGGTGCFFCLSFFLLSCASVLCVGFARGDCFREAWTEQKLSESCIAVLCGRRGTGGCKKGTIQCRTGLAKSMGIMRSLDSFCEKVMGGGTIE